MEKFMSFVVVFGVVAAVLLQRTAAQNAHVVGGSSLNWVVPGNKTAYDTWAAGETFAVGDTLVFNFATGAHNVLEVQKESYDACSQGKTIGSTITTGPATINLTTTGNHYYICTVGQHCNSGQKLSINVTASTASSPKAGGPLGQTTPPSPPPPPPPPTSPGSSPSGVFVSFFVCFFSIVIGFLF